MCVVDGWFTAINNSRVLCRRAPRKATWRAVRTNPATLAPNVGLLQPGQDTEGLPMATLYRVQVLCRYGNPVESPVCVFFSSVHLDGGWGGGE